MFISEIKEDDFFTKSDLNSLISELETKIEKGFKEVIIWVMVAIGGLTIAIIKLF